MKKAIALLLLLCPVITFAQITFEPGYFMQKGSKTECLIKNLAWKNNPVSFEYKLTEGEDIKIKTINEVTEFNVGSAYKYKRFTTNLDRSAIVLDQLSTLKDPQWSKETLFLKVLVEGKITLYQYEDSNFVKYFYSTGDHTVAEQLVYKEYMKDGRIAENNMFRQQLYNIMKDDGNSVNKFERLRYKKDVLVKLFNDYNGTDGQTVVNLSARQNQGSVNLKFTPGATFSSLSVGNSLLPSYSYEFENASSFRIGAELEYIMPFNNNKWGLFLDPNYQSYSKSGNSGNRKMEAKYNFVEIPVGLRHYMFLNQNAKLFVDGAYVISIPVSDSYIVHGGNVLDIERNSALALGAGFSYKKYSVELRHTFKHGLIDFIYWEGSFSTTSVILGYKFL
ncbi:hypothetical protein AMR72_05120 [Flavobacterium psychrophilum]|nr:hypothetical protein AMR72_05120 [Flavobacterium psychrophilum]AOE51954.1 hypothetical protein ALW18_05115 [Flavobacterium psychrophilum]